MKDCFIAGIYPAIMSATAETGVKMENTTLEFGSIENGSKVKEIWRFVKALVH